MMIQKFSQDTESEYLQLQQLFCELGKLVAINRQLYPLPKEYNNVETGYRKQFQDNPKELLYQLQLKIISTQESNATYYQYNQENQHG